MGSIARLDRAQGRHRGASGAVGKASITIRQNVPPNSSWLKAVRNAAIEWRRGEAYRWPHTRLGACGGGQVRLAPARTASRSRIRATRSSCGIRSLLAVSRSAFVGRHGGTSSLTLNGIQPFESVRPPNGPKTRARYVLRTAPVNPTMNRVANAHAIACDVHMITVAGAPASSGRKSQYVLDAARITGNP